MIKQWNDISHKYEGASLILGNGASIAFSNVFDYTRLYEVANDNNYINPKLRSLFRKFGTTNFELVLYRLWQAKEVLNLLQGNTNIVDENYSLCRNALIKTVKDAHIQYDKDDEVFVDKLQNASNFLKNFNIVYSLNYDLILYWVIAMGNREGTIFKDCFWEKFPDTNFNLFNSNWSFLKKPVCGQKKAILIFYPHGNLTLARVKQKHLNEIDLKIVSAAEMHLDAIIETWKNDNLEPVFISEGDCTEKRNRIYESHYLNSVYEKGFEEIGQKLVLYGWSISKEDNHILERIQNIQKERKKLENNVTKKPIESIAVSVYQNGDEQKFKNHVKDKLKYIATDIDFFNSSQGCWCF
ncbi:MULTISPECIES: DUF4917 family protein [Legionella]|nr:MULTISPECIES: DUF4917 family protein [Legionella]AOW51165.1 hypothetical protein BE841_01175 [Legionella pneumophila subsp. pneumophila]AOW55233.1 hypothetical protein BE842_07580 [Legionella pneumophila subsp. pneumophila]AOW64672.1 hypothetical protein BE845_11635 [Legionella pneumophila subsp. pneumophila]CZI70313.1 Uncharacterised protein [Legionella pneumophila]CZI70530.1 Uncharacterised protein [Legionella pneumophila]